jgi:hypothetical protein
VLAYRLLVWASVLGEAFAPEDLSEVIRVDPLEVAEELDRLATVAFSAWRARASAFATGIVRDVLLQTVSPARRRVLHERWRRPVATGSRIRTSRERCR